MAWGASTGFSLRRRLQVLVAGLVIILLAGGGTSLRLVGGRDRALDLLVNRLDPAAEAANVVEAALIDQQAAVSGFVLTGREETLEPFQRAVDREVIALARLDTLLDDLPAAQFVDPAQAAITEWRDAIVAPQLSAKRRGSEPEARALSATGEESFRTAREAVTRVEAALAAARDAEQGRFNASRQGITRAVVANLLVAAGLVILVTFFLRRWVTIPLQELRESVETVAGGELDRAVELEGPEELTTLAADIEAMRRRILSELEDAQRAQEGLAQRAPVVVALRDALAPTVVDVPEGFAFSALFEPAEGVLAGDWYDVMNLPGGRVAVCLGDVAGHGAAPGIFAIRAKELLLAALRLGAGPGEALGIVADQLGLLEESFLTVVAMVIEPSGLFRYANAGHPPPILCSRGGGPIQLQVTGPLLGPLTGRWETDELVLMPGAVLVGYTDGVIEAANADGDEFGVDRLMGCIESNRGEGPDAIIAGCGESLREHSGGRARDDITLFAFQRI